MNGIRIRDRLLHDAGRLYDLRQNLSVAEQVAAMFMPGHQRALDDVRADGWRAWAGASYRP